jgi:hypothetical protein
MPCWPILQGMLKEEASLINYDSPSLIAKTPDHSPSSLPIFILCDKCFWCATYVDKTRIPGENRCPQCNANNNELTSFPIMSNESFTFDYNSKRGVELEFQPRRKGSRHIVLL